MTAVTESMVSFKTPRYCFWLATVAGGSSIACQSTEPVSSAGESGAPAIAGAGTPASAGANAGAAATGGMTSTGQAGTSAGTAGAIGSSAGAGDGGNGGASGNGSANGNGGATAGAGGETNDAAALAPLDGFQLLDPCDLTTYHVEPGSGAVCPQMNEIKNQHVTVHLAGDANITYVVTLRVRGIVERYWYMGGTLDPVSKVFYTGGVPTVGGYASACKNKASDLPFALPADMSPTDGCFNGFNVFGMGISAPKQHYFLNYTTDKVDDRPPHAVYAQDYTVSVEMQGQAAIDFYVIGSDEHECYNHDKLIDEVALPSSPYIGEFLQLNVVGVKQKAG